MIQLSLVSYALDREVIPFLYKHVTLDPEDWTDVLPVSFQLDSLDSAASRLNNDHIPISPRLAKALTHARTMEIQGHIGMPCKARLFTDGLPTEMMKA